MAISVKSRRTNATSRSWNKTGFSRLSTFDRYDYFATLLGIATAAALLAAPSIHHRLLFRQGQKPFIIRIGNQVAIMLAFLTAGLTGILVLISDVIFGGAPLRSSGQLLQSGWAGCGSGCR
jgi:hypothetical protein